MPSSDKQPLALRIRRSEADQRFERHIEEALALLSTPGDTHIMDWFHAKERWVASTSRALKTAFTSAEAAESFEGVAQPHYYARLDRTITQRREDERGQIRDGINRLRSLQEQLQYLAEPSVSAPPAPTAAGELAPAPIDAGRIFVVHGRDTERKLHVARVLERTGNHEVVILHEQSNEGRTLIEKFEKHATAADYAVILLTADDVGGLQPESPDSTPELSLRARQESSLSSDSSSGCSVDHA